MDPSPLTGTVVGEESELQAPEVGRDDDVPVGVQLAWRLRALIRSGRIEPGAKLPGVRELATGAGVNVNTARAVYRRLEQEGLAVSRQGHGTFVAEQPGVSPALEQLAADTAEAATALGLDPRELARTLYAASSADPVPLDQLDQGEVPPPVDDETALSEAEESGARRSLRGQIARLEAELAQYPGTGQVDEGAGGSPPRARPFIADLGELEQIRNDLIRKLNEARTAAEEKGEREGAAREQLEELVADPASHKWERVSNEDLGEPGCKNWHARPAWGPVGALMNWWRVKVSSGCPLAAPREAATRWSGR